MNLAEVINHALKAAADRSVPAPDAYALQVEISDADGQYTGLVVDVKYDESTIILIAER